MEKLARDKILPVRETQYRCDKCGKTYDRADNFYHSFSSMYDNNGCMPICKECLASQYNKYLLTFHDIHKAIKRICMAYDLYYNEDLVDSCMKKSKATPPLGEYVRKLNIVQHRGKTFDNSIDEGFIFDPELEPPDTTDYTVSTIPESVKVRWGSGFSDNDYKILEEHYKLLKKANPDVDSNQEIFIMDLCTTKLLQTKAMQEKNTDNYTKLTETYRKTFAQAGLKTIADTMNSNEDSWGTWMATIGKYTPEEYYKDKDLYKNFGDIGEYIKRFLLRPLKNLQFGTTERDEEFFVDDGDT